MRTLRHPFHALLAAVVLSACATPQMRVPVAVQTQPAWSISGYTEQSFREPDFELGPLHVSKVVRIKRPLTNTQPNAQPASRAFQFEVSAPGQPPLRAACIERIEPRKLWLVRFGQGDFHMDCACHEGELERVSLALVNDQGTLKLASGPRYDVNSIQEKAGGGNEDFPLGYQVVNAQGSGAVDRMGHGRAWPVPGIDAKTQHELGCGYVALLLHRPLP